jgi:guanylate kinase
MAENDLGGNIMNMIYVFIGASACGKTTLCTILDKEYDTVHKVVTDTTRSPRKGEVDKVHYNFVSEQFFRESIDSYVEYNEYDNHLYGSNGTRIADALDSGKADVVICLDINGAKALKKHYGDQVRVIYVHRVIEKIYAAIDERVANGEITVESAVHRKEQVLRDIESRNDPAIDFEVDNNGTLENSINQLKEIMGL